MNTLAKNNMNAIVAGLMLIALGACSSTDMNRGNSNMPDAVTAAGSSGVTPAAQSSGVAPTPQISYGTVQAIDAMTRQDVGVGGAGAAAVGGSLGSPTDKVYRVTVKMDDGSNQMVVVDAMPGYKMGDRVRYSNGTVTSY